MSGGRRAAVVGLVLTKSASCFDHSEMSLIKRGPVILEINWRALPMLKSEMFPLMAVEPKGKGEMVGNFMNLNLSEGSLLGGKKASSSGLLVLEKSGPSGKDPVGVPAGTRANNFPIAEVLMQQNFDKDAELDMVPMTMFSLEAGALIMGHSKKKRSL